jgi:hypothetical protein
MEIRRETGLQGTPPSSLNTESMEGGAVLLPKDKFSKGMRADDPSKAMRSLASSIAGVILKPGQSTPVPLEKAAFWSYQAENEHDIKGVFNAPNGGMYICSHSFDWQNPDRPKAYTVAFDSTGKEIWKFRPEKKYAIDDNMFLADGSAFIMCNSEERWNEPYVVALNPDGSEKWRFQPEKEEKCTSMQLGPDGTLYAKMKDTIYAVDRNGQMKWKKKLNMNSDDYFHEITPRGNNIVVNDNFSLNMGSDSFYSVDPAGKKTRLDYPDIDTFPIRDTKGHLFYGGEKGEFHGVDMDTETHWTVRTDAERGFQTPNWGKDGNIYAQGRYDNSNSLYVFDPQGKSLWKQTIDDHRPPGMGLESFYEVAPDGSVYYAIEDKDAIQVIDRQGNKCKQIDVPGGFSDFKVDKKGNLYIRQYDDKIQYYRSQDGNRYYFPLELANNMDMKEILDDGTVVFQDMCSRYHVKLDKEEEIQKAVEEAKKAEEEAEAQGSKKDEVIVEDNFVVIGNIKIEKH